MMLRPTFARSSFQPSVLFSSSGFFTRCASNERLSNLTGVHVAAKDRRFEALSKGFESESVKYGEMVK
jgi:hypothetical protein